MTNLPIKKEKASEYIQSFDNSFVVSHMQGLSFYTYEEAEDFVVKYGKFYDLLKTEEVQNLI